MNIPIYIPVAEHIALARDVANYGIGILKVEPNGDATRVDMNEVYIRRPRDIPSPVLHTILTREEYLALIEFHVKKALHPGIEATSEKAILHRMRAEGLFASMKAKGFADLDADLWSGRSY